MLVIISPAKKLNTENSVEFNENYQPQFYTEAQKINASLRKKGVKKLMALQNISEDLAKLNFERNQNWGTQKGTTFHKAMHMFQGDVYVGLDAKTLSKSAQKFAENHLRILSGLYGVLRPDDIIEPYRLEMGTKLKVGRPNNLYEFWKNKLTKHVAQYFANEPIINLASNEYAKAIDFKKLPNRVVEVVFKDQNKNGEYKVMSFYAKNARGKMARFILENQIESPEKLVSFNADGYAFNSAESDDDKLVFLRSH